MEVYKGVNKFKCFCVKGGLDSFEVVFKDVSSSQPDQIWGIEARERSCRKHYNDRQNYRRFPAFETLSGRVFPSAA